jgi:RNA polymerase sigma-70 factor (ECF subfamily)
MNMVDLTDEEIVLRVLAGETDAYEHIMRRHNQRLFRVARAILPNNEEAEDVVQDTYVRAYVNLAQFEKRARFGTWLTAILIHEAYARIRKSRRESDFDPAQLVRISSANNPEHLASDEEVRIALEKAIDSLPATYRIAFVLREVEDLSVADAAGCLGISEENVKSRTHRARRLLRRRLQQQFGDAARVAFPFGAAHCDHLVNRVLEIIRKL